MKKLFLASMLLLVTVCGLAQAVDTGTVIPLPEEIEGERRLIQVERSREDARYQTEEAACYGRFVVADCIRQLRVQRRAVLDKLRKREVTLSNVERQRKALAEIDQVKDKSSPLKIEEDAAKRLESIEAQKEREDRATQKPKPNPIIGRSTEKTLEPGRTAEVVSNERQQYNDKLNEAQAYRLSQEKATREKSKKSAKPLPAPP